nr:cytochrome C-type biogenesis protein [Cavernulicola chilensis]
MFLDISHFFLIIPLFFTLHNFFIKGRSSFQPVFLNTSLQFIMIIVAGWCIGITLLVSDFSSSMVFECSHACQPILYKLSTIWSNHEGSFFLWSFLTSFINYVACFCIYKTCNELRSSIYAIIYLKITSTILLVSITFLLLIGNPFLSLNFLAYEGCELNPILQDPNLVVHPPLIYIGYISFLPAFVIIACLLYVPEKSRLTSVIIHLLKISNLIGCLFLTIGILLGSRWAYYELGWGGFWYWDPVENISLIPWLFSISLLHATLLTSYNNQLYKGVIINGIVLYPLGVFSTFAVRSGLLQSVHSFTENETEGIYFISLTFVFIILIFISYLACGKSYFPLHRLCLNSHRNLILYTVVVIFIFLGCFVLVNTFVPIIISFFFSDKLIFGASFFNKFIFIILPLFPILFLVYYSKLKYFAYLLFSSICLYLWLNNFQFNIPCMYYFNSFLIICVFAFWSYKNLSFDKDYSTGAKYSHVGFLMAILSVISSFVYSTEIINLLNPGDAVFIDKVIIIFCDINQILSTSYLSNYAQFLVFDNNDFTYLGYFFPEKRFYYNQNASYVKAVIKTNLFSDFYILFGEGSYGNGWYFRSILLPFMPWFWISGIISCFGVLFSLVILLRRIIVKK